MKKMTIIASIVALASAAAIATFALRGGPKLNPIFEAKATSKSFTFNAAAGSQFKNTPEAAEAAQEVKVTTDCESDPIWTKFTPRRIGSLAFGQNGRFVEAQPSEATSDDKQAFYTLDIGINNLTHFAIDVGVENDSTVEVDMFYITMYEEGGDYPVVFEFLEFDLDANGNGKKSFEWDKGDNKYTVIGVSVSSYFGKDSTEANLYIQSISLAWEC